MIKLFLVKILIAVSSLGFAQKFNNVTWSYSMTQKDCEVELTFTATIADGWYIYSQFQPNTDGPIPTTFSIPKSANYTIVGKVNEGKSKSKYMEGFGGNYNIFSHKAVFTQKIKIHSKKDFELKGELEFMQCDETMCLPPEYVPFSFKIKGANCEASTNVNEPEINVNEDLPVIKDSAETTTSDLKPVAWKIFSKKYSETEYEIFIRPTVDTGWFIPFEKNDAKGIFPLQINFNFPDGIKADGALKKSNLADVSISGFDKVSVLIGKIEFSQKIKVETKDSLLLSNLKVNFSYQALSDGKKAVLNEEQVVTSLNLHHSESSKEVESNQSYFGIFLVAFLSGFLALLTPCVFPMIPMTVSFFLKSSGSKRKARMNALWYGASIVGIYVIIGLAITLIFGEKALNEMSTSLFFNLLFFAVFIFFAISFLGAFEITLPSSWVNAADKNADRGGMIGIFFMAFTLALVSFSCTGPIIGTLLVESVSKGIMGPIIGMFGFSLAIAIPFTMFAIFPGWLNSLPNSGGWLNTVKVSLGFIELALSLKFLSKADLVYQTHYLEREVFFALFIAFFFMWGLYLLGVFAMSHDSGEKLKLSPTRAIFASLVFGFVIYLLPGMWGAPVNLLAGFAPPQEYSESPFGIGNNAPSESGGIARALPKHASYGPNGLITFHDYEHGMEYAREMDMPAMIDFTGYGCENCRKMEQSVWKQNDVKAILKDSVVIISLHVDAREKLADNDPDKSKYRNVGQKWADMEVKQYGEISQPLYVLLDANEEMLNGKASFQTHNYYVDFLNWLREGIGVFKQRKKINVIKPEMKLVTIN